MNEKAKTLLWIITVLFFGIPAFFVWIAFMFWFVAKIMSVFGLM